jgi:hypothetical protein
MPDGYGPLPYLCPPSANRPMPITCRTSAFHPTPSRELTGHDVRYLPSADDTDDRIFCAPGNRPGRPRSEMDLQCINPAGLSCIHERSRAATAASPTYKSEDTPPLASATGKSQHHYYSTTTHHHFATTNNGPQELRPAGLVRLPVGNQPEFLRNSASRRLCCSSCDSPASVANPRRRLP